MPGGKPRQTGPWVLCVPSGAALLCALIALVASGLCDGVLSSLGLGRTACGLWAAAAAGASTLNLPLGASGVLLNPGGTILPLAFACFLWRLQPRGRRAALRVGVAGFSVGVVLCAIPAWALETGVGWPGTVLAALCALAAARGLLRQPGEALLAASGGLAAAAALRYAAGASGLLAWPAALGGGVTFDAGVLALIGGQVLLRLPSLWRGIVRGMQRTEGGRAHDAAR